MAILGIDDFGGEGTPCGCETFSPRNEETGRGPGVCARKSTATEKSLQPLASRAALYLLNWKGPSGGRQQQYRGITVGYIISPTPMWRWWRFVHEALRLTIKVANSFQRRRQSALLHYINVYLLFFPP
jgi:hypothetical protein